MNSTEFQQRMAALPESKTELAPPHWEFWRHQLWRLGQDESPDNFTLWPCVYHTMLVEHWQKPILYELSVVSDFMPLFGKEFSLPEYHNLIHQAYHLYQWEQVTGRRIKDQSTIVEFGGGYGAMALLARRLGFTGRYVIYDLPEFSLLQEWYLSQHGVEAEWNPKRKPKEIDLYMALYSLSEVEPSKRKDFLLFAKSYLFLYSGKWEQWDNVSWFKRFSQETSLKWIQAEISHLPDPQNYYLIGW